MQRALDDGSFKLFWVEPTGTVVSLDIDLSRRKVHDAISFPRWVEQNPARTVCFQNDFLDQMIAYRNAGPTYPMHVVDDFAMITFLEDRGLDDETVIACAPGSLPAGYIDQTN
jgi:phenolic acid decarboxylase